MFQNKVRKLCVFVLLMAMVALLSGCALLPFNNSERQIRNQLQQLDTYCKAEIMEWVEEVARVQFEDFQIDKNANDPTGLPVSRSPFAYEGRFIEWEYQLVDSGRLVLNFIYQAADDFLEDSLAALDQTSLSDIMEWLERIDEMDDIFVMYSSVGPDGRWLSGDIFEDEDMFVAWSFELDRFGFVSLEFVYDGAREFTLGDTFELDGLEVTVADEIAWHTVTRTWSDDYGMPYFSVELSLRNVSDSTQRSLFLTRFGPDGTQLDGFLGENRIEGAGDLRPGAEQSGNVYFEFDGEGDYIAVFRGDVFGVELVIPVDEVELPTVDHYAGLVGTWVWDMDDGYEYLFRADGTGTRGFGRSTSSFTWYTEDETLVIVAGWLEEHWDFSIDRNVLTIESQQVRGLRYRYIRD
ncbi:MAG: hypothetical protein FWE25_11075 [Lachnospiraceae bacterium]|nr:hypothetical protein [Lachnospiraceae bacterium]